ncbi:MAG: 23S rRNA (pseudouridine(1915)-N(3))-methyltransferase RlmH [Alloprevotella sp.]
MKTLFLVVGKTTDKFLDRLIEEYAGRLGHYVPFEMEVIPELKNTRGMPPEVQKEREGEQILRRLQGGDYVVLLDEGGMERRSVDFAAWFDSRQQAAGRRMVFVVGGPYGFSAAVYAAAREQVSLSKMTFSHQMVRLLFVEQLYRAMTILRGEPYHHE